MAYTLVGFAKRKADGSRECYLHGQPVTEEEYDAYIEALRCPYSECAEEPAPLWETV